VRDGPSARAALPNLIVIGAKKSGTTSLHQYLAAHPEISMSTEKELDFFVVDRNWAGSTGTGASSIGRRPYEASRVRATQRSPTTEGCPSAWRA
jgi:hypothetical protein